MQKYRSNKSNWIYLIAIKTRLVQRKCMPKVNHTGKGKIESECITFRIERNILEELRQESNEKAESINTLVNQIFRQYVKWHNPASKTGFMYWSIALLTRMIDFLTNEEVVELAEHYVKNELKGIMRMIGQEYTVSSFLDGFLTWLRVSSIRYKHMSNENVDDCAIYLNMGRKWSIWFENYLQFVFEDLKEKNVELEVTDNTVSFKLKK